MERQVVNMIIEDRWAGFDIKGISRKKNNTSEEPIKDKCAGFNTKGTSTSKDDTSEEPIETEN